MRKILCLFLVCLLFVSFFVSCSSPADKIDPEYYALGKEMVGLSDAFLADEISLEDAKARAESISNRLEALPLLPKDDPQYDETDRVSLYISGMCLSFATTHREDRTLSLREDLEKFGPKLRSILGLPG